MSQTIFRMTMSEMFVAATRGTLPQGWLYLPDAELTPASACLLITDEAHFREDDSDPENLGAPFGFPIESLDTDTIEQVCHSAKLFCDQPSDELYLRAFDYYCRFDAFLPAADAPDPPPIDVVREKLDREFYTSLGPERAGSRCRREGCERGAVNMSAFCAKHHFEMIYKRPYLFE
jgi:hypothetical protein